MNQKEKLSEIIKDWNFDATICNSCNQSYSDCLMCSCKELADYLLANGVIVLPCKFQQMCYAIPTIENSLTNITEMKCIGFCLSCDSYNINLITDKNKLYQPCFGDFGKTVFLTREEAEKELAERNKSNDKK